MTATNFDRCLAFTMKHEGGGTFTNDPRDPGGATKYGITARTLAAWRHNDHLVDTEVETLGYAEASTIYRVAYWNALHGDDLPRGIDLMIFDFGVNIGQPRAAMILQGILRVTPDGHIGPQTLLAVKGFGDGAGLVETLYHEQLDHYEHLKGWNVYGEGWRNRTQERAILAAQMIAA